ncbi:hypothetical protein CTI12_AA052830 [Artemisia annua]|uniref:Uncharacterized protein n=1 Tax=Artemisia annua TaxID=35608 RepID=A0A2U1QB74_ARTAN|nr:hypothetical protein CTI12_AA052830 [Artemisia annua]
MRLFKFVKSGTYLEEVEHNQDIRHDQTLGDFIKSHGYSGLFQKAYIVKELENRGCQIRTGCAVRSVASRGYGKEMGPKSFRMQRGIKATIDENRRSCSGSIICSSR